MNESALIDKLRLIEALHAGAATPGERNAAEHARQRILDRLSQNTESDEPVEFRFSLGDLWSRKVFVALCRRYGLRPYRRKRQRYTTVMCNAPRRFVDDVLWPEFEALSKTLNQFLSDVTDRVVGEVLHADHSEAEVIEEKCLPLPFDLQTDASTAETGDPGRPDAEASAMAARLQAERLQAETKPAARAGRQMEMEFGAGQAAAAAQASNGPSSGTKADKKIPRNKPCPCGSKKKYKRCCGAA